MALPQCGWASSNPFGPEENKRESERELEENMILASRNLQNVVLIDASEINVLDLIAADKVLTTEDAIRKIEEVLK